MTIYDMPRVLRVSDLKRNCRNVSELVDGGRDVRNAAERAAQFLNVDISQPIMHRWMNKMNVGGEGSEVGVADKELEHWRCSSEVVGGLSGGWRDADAVGAWRRSRGEVGKIGGASRVIKGLMLTWRGFLCGDIADGDETKEKKAEKKELRLAGVGGTVVEHRSGGGRLQQLREVKGGSGGVVYTLHEVGACCKSGAADRLQWRPMGSDEGTAGMGWFLLQVGGCCGKAAGVEQQGASALRRNVGWQIGATEAAVDVVRRDVSTWNKWTEWWAPVVTTKRRLWCAVSDDPMRPMEFGSTKGCSSTSVALVGARE
ncbi:hypothetical protein F5887DRAFT_915172 [Amanita rubescens]|nr:hypothetical protein F5887DRAFT_915172 [Amanita rubescens]